MLAPHAAAARATGTALLPPSTALLTQGLPHRGRGTLPPCWEPGLSSVPGLSSGDPVCGPYLYSRSRAWLPFSLVGVSGTKDELGEADGGDQKASEVCCSKASIPASETAKRREERSPEPLLIEIVSIILPTMPPVLLSLTVLLPAPVQELPSPGCSSATRLWAIQDALGWQNRSSPSPGGPLVSPDVSGPGEVLIFSWS